MSTQVCDPGHRDHLAGYSYGAHQSPPCSQAHSVGSLPVSAQAPPAPAPSRLPRGPAALQSGPGVCSGHGGGEGPQGEAFARTPLPGPVISGQAASAQIKGAPHGHPRPPPLCMDPTAPPGTSSQPFPAPVALGLGPPGEVTRSTGKVAGGGPRGSVSGDGLTHPEVVGRGGLGTVVAAQA